MIGGEEPRDDDRRVDEAIAESFPASDPPAWTLGVEPHPPTTTLSTEAVQSEKKQRFIRMVSWGGQETTMNNTLLDSGVGSLKREELDTVSSIGG
jgi:hypothetical protein